MKVENNENNEKELGMTKEERRKLIEYLEQQGWSAEQIVALFKFISE